MLFSEPKIPQSNNAACCRRRLSGFSALQRAENSSIQCGCKLHRLLHRFQCSSASRKFLNSKGTLARDARCDCFSALQRAENSSSFDAQQRNSRVACFSALQRAENSSIQTVRVYTTSESVSVLFSEPKIPQAEDDRQRRLHL